MRGQVKGGILKNKNSGGRNETFSEGQMLQTFEETPGKARNAVSQTTQNVLIN